MRTIKIMNKNFIIYAIMFVVLVLVQALLLNHIVLFNCSICFIFIYFLIKLPLGISNNALLSLAFCLGLSVDILSDTAGLNALCCTILAILKNPIFYAYEQHDDHNRNIIPGLNPMGWLNFCKFLISMSAIYSFMAVTVEYAAFVDFLTILIKTGASTAFTFALILATDTIFDKKQQSGY